MHGIPSSHCASLVHAGAPDEEDAEPDEDVEEDDEEEDDEDEDEDEDEEPPADDADVDALTPTTRDVGSVLAPHAATAASQVTPATRAVRPGLMAAA